MADPETIAANALEDMVNGYDIGDLRADIDRQVGEAIERAMQRYTGRDRACEIRREIIEWLADEVTGSG